MKANSNANASEFLNIMYSSKLLPYINLYQQEHQVRATLLLVTSTGILMKKVFQVISGQCQTT